MTLDYKYKCELCNNIYSTSITIEKHKLLGCPAKAVNTRPHNTCENCNQNLMHLDSYYARYYHVKHCKSRENNKCVACNKHFVTEFSLLRHLSKCKLYIFTLNLDENLKNLQTAKAN